MDTNRRDAAVAGALSIVGMIAGVLSIVPVIEKSDYLALISTHEGEVIRGAVFQLIMVPAYVGFALSLYPTLKLANDALSLGFVTFRLIAAMLHLVGVILLPLFVVLGQDYVQAGDPDASHIEILGHLLRSGRDLVNHVALIIALSIGDLFLFYVLYQWRLVPRWLSTWGFLGAGLAILASLMLLSGLTNVITPLYLAMNAPLALQNLVFAMWLITRGFETSLLKPRLAKRTVLGRRL